MFEFKIVATLINTLLIVATINHQYISKFIFNINLLLAHLYSPCLELDRLSFLQYILFINILLMLITFIGKQLNIFFAILKEVSSFNLFFANFFKFY